MQWNVPQGGDGDGAHNTFKLASSVTCLNHINWYLGKRHIETQNDGGKTQ